MFIDDHIVLNYLKGDIIENHWIFYNVEKGKYLFESPDPAKHDDVNDLLLYFKDVLSHFNPLNENIYSILYPKWKTRINSMNVLLSVGNPKPYDALVREYDDQLYLVFDLIRFCDYKDSGHNIDLLIKQLITHETSHLCLRKKYPGPTSNGFVDRLKYTIFDEGFAHLLAFKDNVAGFDFSGIMKKYYDDSLTKLKEAMVETDPQRQKDLLLRSNSGNYWSKFAAIGGKLFLASHMEEIQELYNNGVDNFVSHMGL